MTVSLLPRESNVRQASFSGPHRGIWVWTASLFFLLCNLATAEVELLNVSGGVDGWFKVGRWAPLRFDVQITGESGEEASQELVPRIRTVDPDGHAVETLLPPLSPVPGTPTHIDALFRSGRTEAPVTIEILSGDRVVASRQLRADASGSLTALEQSGQLWIVAGEQPAFEAAFRRAATANPRAIQMVQREGFGSWTGEGRSLDSVDLIVVNAETEFSAEASGALERWVSRGGRLVVVIGDASERLNQSELKNWLPLLPRGTVEVRNLSPLNAVIPGSGRLRMIGSLAAADLQPETGQVVATGLNRPLIVRCGYGLGLVTTMALRLDEEPLASWGSRSELAMILAGRSPLWDDSSFLPQRSESGLSPTGVSDFQTQIVQAIDSPDELPRQSYWISMGWMALLALLIGPVDYYLVHYVLKRPQLTWITFPLWLAAIGFLTVKSAFATNEHPMTARQIEMVDVDATLGELRGRSWFNLYSPQSRRYDIKASVDFTSHLPAENVDFTLTSWVERPESGYRGMYRSGGLDSQKPLYHVSDNGNQVPDLPIRIWSTGALASEWEADVDAKQFVVSQLYDEGTGRLKGTLQHNLPGPIRDWFLAYGNFAYVPRSSPSEGDGELMPGDSFNLELARTNILRGVLLRLQTSTRQGRVSSKVDGTIDRERYDPLSKSAYDILRIVSFHEVVGGRSYSTLSNQSLSELDVSQQVQLGKAVLFGRLDHSATQYAVDDDNPDFENRELIVRIILPVRVDKAVLNAPPDPSLLKLP